MRSRYHKLPCGFDAKSIVGSEYARVAKCLFGGQLESFEQDGCSVGLEDRIISRDTQMVGESKMSSHLPEIQAGLPSMSSVDRGPAPQLIITPAGSKSTSTLPKYGVVHLYRSLRVISDLSNYYEWVKACL